MKNVILSTLLATSCVSGFTVAQEIVPEQHAELMIWSDHGKSTKFMEYAAKEFNQQHGYDVKFTFRSLSPVDTATRLIQDGGTTKVGDVVEIEHDTLGRLVVAGGVMENLVSTDRIEKEFINGAVAASKDNNVGYGFPVSFATIVMYYNKDLLEQAPMTFEELIKYSETFNDTKQQKYALLWNVQNYYESRMFFAMNGGYEFGNNGADASDLGIATEDAAKGLALMLKLKQANSANSADLTDPQVRRGLFQEGKVAAIVDGPWAAAGYAKSGMNFGVAPIPTLDGNHPRTFSTVRLAVVSAFTEYPRAAQLFADFISTKEMAKKRFEMTGAIPPIESVMNEVASNAEPVTKAVIAQGFHADAMPSIPEMGYIWQPMNAAITDVWENGRDIDEALKKAESVVAQQISMQQ
ncbi:sugar ABC transporter substrate-binding protein [Vibrio owensii 47666-1]|uniref:sugar ABC transporter substrate-binding protein n=1 Tax=Vibrio owensii TaxID=696485 RepID=UPI000584F205|nr:maltose ABC transporter substrate-binding protein [Vibrio owensii]KIF46293.1 sugar ABC transporter substrate-binding protein [Vibrio owensii 47666-1]